MNHSKHLSPADIPAELRDIAQAIGPEALYRLALLRGGQNLYIPKAESLTRRGRNRAILAQFDGTNARELSAQFRLSLRQIHKILREAGNTS